MWSSDIGGNRKVGENEEIRLIVIGTKIIYRGIEVENK